MRTTRYFGRTAMQTRPAALAVAVALAIAGCTGGVQREAERTESRVKDDVRGVRDFIYDRGITIDTRTAP
jgi:hypothetical protein